MESIRESVLEALCMLFARSIGAYLETHAVLLENARESAQQAVEELVAATVDSPNELEKTLLEQGILHQVEDHFRVERLIHESIRWWTSHERITQHQAQFMAYRESKKGERLPEDTARGLDLIEDAIGTLGELLVKREVVVDTLIEKAKRDGLEVLTDEVIAEAVRQVYPTPEEYRQSYIQLSRGSEQFLRGQGVLQRQDEAEVELELRFSHSLMEAFLQTALVAEIDLLYGESE